MGASVVIGTAGHIDHGKSSLVEALTGVHPDRLQEEKRRGITIELGFARLDLPGGVQAGLVDVPGHERFVRTMVAGAGGIDLVLLVVAADEGVMPQTREHLDVCRLLGVEAGVVALTKCDALDGLEAGWAELVESDIRESVRGTFLEGAPIVRVSAVTGEGLETLRETLTTVARDRTGRPADGPLFLPVDRAFVMKGFGTVVTGTLLSGSLALEDHVEIEPGVTRGTPVRVRQVQVHGESVDSAHAGQRTAVNLAGLEKAEISRGSVLVEKGAEVCGRLWDVRLDALPALDRPIKNRSRLFCHLGTDFAEAEVVLLEGSRLMPGARAFAQLHLDEPMAALPGQPFILRGSRILSGRGRTVAGGRILARATRRRRPSHSDATEGLAALASGEEAERVEALVRLAGPGGLPEAQLPYASGLPRRRLARLLESLTSRGTLLIADTEQRVFVHAEVMDALADAATVALEQHHATAKVSGGMSREPLRSALPGPPGPRLFTRLLARLEKDGTIIVEADRVRLAATSASLEGDDARDGERLAAALRDAGLTPPRPKELADTLRLDLERTMALLGRLCETGEVVRVKRDLYFAAAPLDDLRARLEAHLDAHGEITTQQFKELTGATRKHSIPLGEHFDETRVTLRVGDRRVRRGSREASP